MTAPEQPKRRGPKPKSGEVRDVLIQVRCTRAEREKFDALGGADWFRPLLHRAKLPTT